MGILNAMLGRREPAVEYRTVDGGHPAPFPDMTDEQLYNYEVAFNVPKRTFDRPPRSRHTERTGRVDRVDPAEAGPRAAAPRPYRATNGSFAETASAAEKSMRTVHGYHEPAPERAERLHEPEPAPEPPYPRPRPLLDDDAPPIDYSRPVRTVTTRHPVEIITTRARHPVYKVHAYIGDDDVVTVFTLDGRLSENGPRFIENAPQKERIFLNIYPDPAGAANGEPYRFTQHRSLEEADACATSERIACVPIEFCL